MTQFKQTAARTVLTGDYIPMHDETFDIAEKIATQLEVFEAYVESVRDEEQAVGAVAELLAALLKQVQQPEHTFRVVHEQSGAIAYEGPSYTAAAGTQYSRNVEESAVRAAPLWRLWLVDMDGIVVRVSTQQ